MPTNVKVRVITFFTAGLLLCPLFAQRGGNQTPPPTAPPAGGGTTTQPGGGTPGRFPTPGTDRNPTQQPGQNPNQMPEMQRPIFLSGKVMVDDGTPPPEQAVIERVCAGAGSGRPEAYTDSKGRFSFEVGRNNGMFADASVSGMGGADSMGPGGFGGMDRTGGSRNPFGGMSERQLSNCELRAVLPGFRSEVVSLVNHRAFDNPDVGTIVLHRLGKVEGRVISATSLNAPKDARKAFEKAQNDLKKKKVDDAVKNFEKAVESYPKYAAAWFELGRLQEAQKQTDQAQKSYRQAIEADPKYISPWMQLADMAYAQKNWKDLADTTDHVLKLDPFDQLKAYVYNSVANFNVKNLDAAEKSAREAQKLDSRHQFPQMKHLLGVILAQKQDYTGAAEQMRGYLQLVPGGQDATMVRNQLAEIEKLAGGPKTTEGPAQPQ